MSDPRLTRTAVPFKLVDEDGNKLELFARPFSDDNFTELNQWIRREYINRIEDACSEMTDPHLRDRVINAAIATVPTLDYMDRSIGTSMFSSVDGLAKALSITLREDNPDITPERLKSLMRRAASFGA